MRTYPGNDVVSKAPQRKLGAIWSSGGRAAFALQQLEQRALLHRARGVWRSLPVPRDAEALTDGRLSTVVGDAADGDKPSAETIAGEGEALFAGK